MGSPLGEIFAQDGGQSSLDSGSSSGQNGDQQGQGSFNPNFQPLLNELPQDLHEKVLPHLQQWDTGVNQRFEKLQSAITPWQPILSAGVTPDMAQNGLNIMNLLERDPEALWKVLGDSYGFGKQESGTGAGAGQGQTPQQQQQQITPEPDLYDNRFNQLDQNFQTLAQHVLDIKRQEQEAAADAAVADEFKAAHDKLGQFDDNWVRAHCIADPTMSIEQAAKNYQQWHAQELARYGARPLITGSAGSGGVPGSQVDVTKLSGKDVRALVADRIRQAKLTGS